MRKIPTLFVRDQYERRYVTSEVTPGCEWVLDGEGVATRKYDGTCVMLRIEDGEIVGLARREVKLGKPAPSRWEQITCLDPVTEKWIGWEPIEQSGFVFPFAEALSQVKDLVPDASPAPGTYELCGPKINGNPERFAFHVLVSHDLAEHVDVDVTGGYLTIRAVVARLPYEGVVWHHPDGRMTKLKRRDLRAS